jgi:hypothetical protein
MRIQKDVKKTGLSFAQQWETEDYQNKSWIINHNRVEIQDDQEEVEKAEQAIAYSLTESDDNNDIWRTIHILFRWTSNGSENHCTHLGGHSVAVVYSLL